MTASIDQNGNHATGRNPFVFVVGCPRSGTTLLQRMLDHHPQLTVANDTHFIPRAVKDLEVRPDLPLTPELVERVRTYRRFHRLGVDDAAVDRAAAGAATYAAFVGTLYDELATQRGKPYAGEKTPDYVRNLPMLHALFPRARSIHIIRDGRDVALSTLEWARPDKGPGRIPLWAEQPLAVAALWWRRNVRIGLDDAAALAPSAHLTVRYEDLVADPRVVLRDLAAFLDLPDAPEMADFHVGRTKSDPGLSAKKAWLPATRGVRDWRTDMPERDVALFEALAGDVLEATGYERAVAHPPDDVTALAERCRAWWAERRWHRLSGSREGADLGEPPSHSVGASR